MSPVATSISPSTMRWLLRATVTVLVIGVAVYLLRGVNTTKRPKLDSNGATASRVAGFDQIGFEVHTAAGASSRHCGLLALTTLQQDRGLMNRTNLAGYDGMLFQFLDPTTVEFYMKDTLISLSIAWFDANGRFISSTDMTPCGNAAVCPLYHSAAPYTLALEVPLGQLGHVGVAAGSTVTVGGSC